MKEAIRTIRSEHRSIAAVLSALKELTRMAGSAGTNPDFRAFRAIVRYIDEYPERFHHPKEDRYLFASVRKRSPAAAELVRKLEAEHEKGAKLVRELERALVIFEDRWPQGWGDFSSSVDEYCRFQFDHMRTEEQELLPLAERHLSAEDWQVVDEGFSGHADPVEEMQERTFEELFTRLVNLAPAPVGLGEPWPKTA